MTPKCLYLRTKVQEWYEFGGVETPGLFIEATIIFGLTDYANFYNCNEKEKIEALKNILKALADDWSQMSNEYKDRFIISTKSVSKLITDCENNRTNIPQWALWADIQQEKDIDEGIIEFNTKVLNLVPYKYVAEGDHGEIRPCTPKIGIPLDGSILKEDRYKTIGDNLSEDTPEVAAKGFEIHEDGESPILEHFARHWHGQLTPLDSVMREINKNTPIPHLDVTTVI